MARETEGKGNEGTVTTVVEVKATVENGILNLDGLNREEAIVAVNAVELAKTGRVKVMIPNSLSEHDDVMGIIRYLKPGMSAQVQGKSWVTECLVERVPVFRVMQGKERIRTTLAPDGAYGAAEALLFGLVPMSRKLKRA